MRFKGLFKLGLLWILLASCVWAQGDRGSSKLPVSIYYSLPPAHARVLEGFVTEYRQTHTYLDITTRNFPQPEDLYKAMTSGAEPPTLALLETSWLDTVTQKQPNFIPVETWMPKEQFLFNWSVKCNCFVPLWDGSHVNGKLMALPYFWTTKALIVNTDVLSAAGVKALPATWDQLAKTAEKISATKGRAGIYTLALSVLGTPEQNARSLQILAWQLGAEALEGTSPMTGQAVQKATDMLSAWNKFLAPLDAPVTQRGSVAFWIGNVEDYLTLRGQGLPVKAAPLPGLDKKNKGSEVQGWSLGMFKTVPDNQLYKVQELAFFLVDFPQQLRWAEETPYLAAHLKVFDNPFYRRERLADHSNLRVFLNSLGGSKLLPNTDRNIATYRSIGKNLGTLVKTQRASLQVANPH